MLPPGVLLSTEILLRCRKKRLTWATLPQVAPRYKLPHSIVPRPGHHVGVSMLRDFSRQGRKMVGGEKAQPGDLRASSPRTQISLCFQRTYSNALNL